jgi:molybdopterin molybdotransferase
LGWFGGAAFAGALSRHAPRLTIIVVEALHFEAARDRVLQQTCAARGELRRERVALPDSCGRVLATDVAADRDYPPAARSVRDGFAVRAADTPGLLRIIGETRAGEAATLAVAAGEALEIMTGAPMPGGANAVVMVEHVSREGDYVRIDRKAAPGQFINPQAAEAAAGEVLLRAGTRLDHTAIAMLATVGVMDVEVFVRPRVAILPTGDEIVEAGETPLAHQIRNSNAYSLAAQVIRAGGVPVLLPVARDEYEHTRTLVERGLEEDLLLLSGGVSAGKYDIVERVLADLGAQFFFERVLIQPGQPLVFGQLGPKLFFGLPGNPASTIVTFELFARAALELLSGQCHAVLRTTAARLTRDFRHRAGLTRFLPAVVSDDGAQLTPVPWKGSSDVPALMRANAFLIAEPDHEEYKAGEVMRVLPK